MQGAIFPQQRLPAARSRSIGARFAGRLLVLAWLALGLFLSACSSTGTAPVTSGLSDPWTAVQEIDRGADLQVSVDCSFDADHDACVTNAPPGDTGSTIRVVTGKHVEADGQSLLFRPIQDEAALLRVDRGMVQSIDVMKEDSTRLGTVLGAAIGVSAYALSPLRTFDDYTITQRLIYAWMFGLPSGWLGHLIDRSRSRGKFTTVRVYQRNTASSGSARRAPHPSLS